MSSNIETPDDKNINNIIAEVNALVKTYRYSSIDLVPIPEGENILFKIFGSLIKPYTVEEHGELDKMNPLNGGIIIGKNDIKFEDVIPMIKMSTALQQETIDPTANNAVIRVLLRYDQPDVRLVDIEIIKREFLIDDIAVMADHDAIAFAIPSTEVSEVFTLLHNPTVNVTIEPGVPVNVEQDETARLANVEAAMLARVAVENIQAEAVKKIQEEAVKKIQEEAAKKIQEEAAKKIQEEAAKKIQEEAAKKIQEEAAKKIQEEAVKKIQEEAAKKIQEEAVKKIQEEAAKKIQEEAVKKIQEEAAKKIQEEAARVAVENIQAEAVKKLVDDAAKQAAEETAMLEEQREREEITRKQVDAAKQKLADDELAAKKIQEETARVANELAAKQKADQKLVDEQRRNNLKSVTGDVTKEYRALSAVVNPNDDIDAVADYTNALSKVLYPTGNADTRPPPSVVLPPPPSVVLPPPPSVVLPPPPSVVLPPPPSVVLPPPPPENSKLTEIVTILNGLNTLFTTPYTFKPGIDGIDFINRIGSLSHYNEAYNQPINTGSKIRPLTVLQRATISAWNAGYKLTPYPRTIKMQADGFKNGNLVYYLKNSQPVDIRSTIKTAYTNFMKEFASSVGLQSSLFNILNAKEEETDWFKRIVDTIRGVKDANLFGNNRISQYYNCLIIVVMTENTRRLLDPGTGNNIDEKIISYFHMLRRLTDYFERPSTNDAQSEYNVLKDFALFLERGILTTHPLHNTHITRLLSAIRKPSTNAQYLDVTGISEDKVYLVGIYKPIQFKPITKFKDLDLSTLMYQIYQYHHHHESLRGGSPTKKNKPTISSTNRRTKRPIRINRSNQTHNKLPRNIRRQSRKRRSIKIIPL